MAREAVADARGPANFTRNQLSFFRCTKFRKIFLVKLWVARMMTVKQKSDDSDEFTFLL